MRGKNPGAEARMSDWPAELRSCIEKGEVAVLVTVAEVRGSSPRSAGTRMLVTANDVIGTVGGGTLEIIEVMACRCSSPRDSIEGKDSR